MGLHNFISFALLVIIEAYKQSILVVLYFTRFSLLIISLMPQKSHKIVNRDLPNFDIDSFLTQLLLASHYVRTEVCVSNGFVNNLA